MSLHQHILPLPLPMIDIHTEIILETMDNNPWSLSLKVFPNSFGHFICKTSYKRNRWSKIAGFYSTPLESDSGILNTPYKILLRVAGFPFFITEKFFYLGSMAQNKSSQMIKSVRISNICLVSPVNIRWLYWKEHLTFGKLLSSCWPAAIFNPCAAGIFKTCNTYLLS